MAQEALSQLEVLDTVLVKLTTTILPEYLSSLDTSIRQVIYSLERRHRLNLDEDAILGFQQRGQSVLEEIIESIDRVQWHLGKIIGEKAPQQAMQGGGIRGLWTKVETVVQEMELEVDC